MIACRRRPWIALLAGGLLAGLLAGCGGLLPKPPERQLYRAEPSFAFPAGLPHVPVHLAIATPSAVDGLDGRRIALTRSPVTLDYYADAEWTDRAPFLVRAALVEGFRKSGAVATVGPESLGTRADFLLDAAIRHFEAAYAAPDRPPVAVVALDLALVRLPERRIVAQTTVRGEAPAAANKLPEIAAAFGAALSRAAEAAVGWTVNNPGLSGRPGSVVSRTRFVHPTGARSP